MLSGCAAVHLPNVNLNSTAQNKQLHPYLHAALINQRQHASIHTIFGANPSAGMDSWGFCRSKKSGALRDCRMGEIYHTIGPAPLLAAAVKTKGVGTKTHQPLIPLGVIVGGTTIGVATSMASTGGLGVGGVVLGALEILGAGHGQTPVFMGLNHFVKGQSLYAVRYIAHYKSVSHQFYRAVHFAPIVSARYGGSLPSWNTFSPITSGMTPIMWAPTSWVWQPENISDCGFWFTPLDIPKIGETKHFTKARHTAYVAVITPSYVWQNNLSPMLKTTAITVVWHFAAGSTRVEHRTVAETLSRDYPKWRFVTYLDHPQGKSWAYVCVDGTCQKVPFSST